MSDWDDIDKWAEEQRKNLPLRVGPGECAETGKTISRERARTIQAAARLAMGVHPTGVGLRSASMETCATCVHFRVKSYAGTYFKCALVGDTNGSATDIRKGWPACERWRAK